MKKGNLLIVDDEPLLIKMLQMNLSDLADKVFVAQNGIEALEVIEENGSHIHCIVCDINMPQLNGVDVIKKIRAQGNDVPFIFYTGHGNHDLMMEAIKYGAFDFLNKPNFESLEEVVTRALKEGLNDDNSQEDFDESHLSDYQKLLREAEKK